MRPRAMLLGLAAAAFALAACGGGSDPLAEALEGVATDDLAIMVLDADDLGALVDGMEVNGDDSGPADADDVIDDFNVIEMDEARLQELGFQGGYALGYQDLAALNGGGARMLVLSELELFADAEGAAEYFELALEDMRMSEGVWDDGVRANSVEIYELPDLADSARGIVADIEIAGWEVPFNYSLVAFRRDRIVGVAAFAHVDSREDHSPTVEGLAQDLDAKIRAVLLGERSGTPVPVPVVGTDDATVEPPVGGPDLEAMSLTIDDLPEGTEIDTEGYYPDTTAVATFDREFEHTELILMGNSAFLSVENEISLYLDVDSASRSVTSFADYYSGEGAVDRFVAAIGSGGFDLSNAELSGGPIQLGDEATWLAGAGDSALGRTVWGFVFVRVDRVVAEITVYGTADRFDERDLIALAKIVADRMETELR